MSQAQERLRKIFNEHCLSLLEFFYDEKISFSLICYQKDVEFSPDLPSEITSKFNEIVNFYIGGYTLDSLMVKEIGDEDFLFFEAGFGPDNIGTLVTININNIQAIGKKLDNGNEIIIFTRSFNLDSMEESKKENFDPIFSNPHNLKVLENLKNKK